MQSSGAGFSLARENLPCYFPAVYEKSNFLFGRVFFGRVFNSFVGLFGSSSQPAR